MVKKDVILYGLRPEMVMAHSEIKETFSRLNYKCVITSAVGKKHKKRSFHSIGFALDYRTKHILGSVLQSREVKLSNLLFNLKKEHPYCDFLLEHVGKPQEHIHAEFDPKNDSAFATAKELYKKTGVWG